MSLTTDSRQSVVERVQRDPDFAKTLLHAVSQWRARHRSADPARSRERDRGIRKVGRGDRKTKQESAQDALKKGNPSMDNLAAIFDAVRKRLGVNLQAQTVEAA